MSKPEMTLRTRFGTSAMFSSAKEVSKHTLKMTCMYPLSRKFLVSVGQMVEQGMQVRFDQDGCFIEKEDRIIARGRREGRISSFRMFILDSHKMKSAMFAKSTKVDSDIGCGTSELATSISTNSRQCNRKEQSSDSRHSKRRRLKVLAKRAN